MGYPKEDLRAEVEQARTVYRQALARFREVADDSPSGIPRSDGIMRIAQAGQEVRRALALYTDAVKRENEFLVDRAIGDGSDAPKRPD